jgi:hypothetical protein
MNEYDHCKRRVYYFGNLLTYSVRTRQVWDSIALSLFQNTDIVTPLSTSDHDSTTVSINSVLIPNGK